jgi:hypothetical protein
MSKIDDLERMLEEAKQEEANKDSGWIKYVVYFFIFVLMVRGCSGDKNHEVQEQAPIEQSAESIQYYDETSNNQPDPVEEQDKRISTPEEKLESLTGEKIDVKDNTAEEIADSAVTQHDESLL